MLPVNQTKSAASILQTSTCLIHYWFGLEQNRLFEEQLEWHRLEEMSEDEYDALPADEQRKIDEKRLSVKREKQRKKREEKERLEKERKEKEELEAKLLEDEK